MELLKKLKKKLTPTKGPLTADRTVEEILADVERQAKIKKSEITCIPPGFIVQPSEDIFKLLYAKYEPHPDTLRLDWLADNKVAIRGDDKGKFFFLVYGGEIQKGTFKTPRDAIAAAMKASEK